MRTKIVATLGPASRDPAIIRQLIQAGMSVARLNFSHGTHEEHARDVEAVRAIAAELDAPVTILQDLQGPKIRVGRLPDTPPKLDSGTTVRLIPVPVGAALARPAPAPSTDVPIDYPDLAAHLHRDDPILLDDGRLELRVDAIEGTAVRCRVVDGGPLRDRVGVVLPTIDLPIPSLTEKDLRDLDWGVAHRVDWIALSFVRRAADVHALRERLRERGADVPVLAKIETRQALDNLDEIVDAVQGLMVARGDLGLELRPEKVPVAQKAIIRACNARGVPVITATQMLESMMTEPRPTRAEASDVANAIEDGSDCIMLSGESAIGKYPVRAVEMMARIAREVEPTVRVGIRPTVGADETSALAQAIHVIDRALPLACIAAFSTSGYTGRLVAAQRPRAAVVILTPNPRALHTLNLMWGARPILLNADLTTFDDVVHHAEQTLLAHTLAAAGDRVLIVAGLPMSRPGGTNLLKIHTIGV